MKVVATDPGDIEASVARALAEVGICVVVEVLGGPAPVPEDPTEWDASVTVVERPAVNRADRFDGKTADVVVDAVLRTFANGGYFRAVRVRPASEEGVAAYEIEGKTTIVLREAAEGQGGEC